jgi:hypothetical protein
MAESSQWKEVDIAAVRRRIEASSRIAGAGAAAPAAAAAGASPTTTTLAQVQETEHKGRGEEKGGEHDDEKEEECSICLELICDVVEDSEGWDTIAAVTTDCGHCFHRMCLSEWQAVSRTCPNCRAPTDGKASAAGCRAHTHTEPAIDFIALLEETRRRIRNDSRFQQLAGRIRRKIERVERAVGKVVDETVAQIVERNDAHQDNSSHRIRR